MSLIKQYFPFLLAALMFIVAFACAQAIAGEQEGVISGNVTVQGEPIDQATRSQADWYDVKPLIGAVDTVSVITPATKWGTSKVWLVKALYNNSGTAVVVRFATYNKSVPTAADTVRLKLPAYTISMKLPKLSKIFKLGATDSLLVFMQVD